MYLSSGRRSMNLRVMGAWISNSARSVPAMDITVLLFVRSATVEGKKADPADSHEWPLLDGGFGAGGFGALAHAIVNERPARVDAGLVLFLNQTKAGVAK